MREAAQLIGLVAIALEAAFEVRDERGSVGREIRKMMHAYRLGSVRDVYRGGRRGAAREEFEIYLLLRVLCDLRGEKKGLLLGQSRVFGLGHQRDDNQPEQIR